MASTKLHGNNFDFLRVAAAVMVLFSHQFALLALPQPMIFSIRSVGSLGVSIFFTISGYLVLQSWLRDPHVTRFVLRRFLRIWPGLIVVTCLAALFMGPLVSNLTYYDYFHSKHTWHFFRTLLLDITYVLPGVFSTNFYPHAVNGSLWTIPFEIRWYGILVLVGFFKLFNYKWLILAAFCILIIDQFVKYHAGIPPSYMSEFGFYFVYGACLHLFRAVWMRYMRLCLVLASLLVFASVTAGYPIVALWLALPYLIIFVATCSTPIVRQFGRFGDLSYGIYIYAFPVQQLVVKLGEGQFSFPVCLLFSVLGTGLLAFASWHLVEKPALQLKRILRVPPPNQHKGDSQITEKILVSA